VRAALQAVDDGGTIQITQAGVYDDGTAQNLEIDKNVTIEGTVDGVKIQQEAYSPGADGPGLVGIDAASKALTVTLRRLELRIDNATYDHGCLDIRPSGANPINLTLENVILHNDGQNKGVWMRNSGTGAGGPTAPITFTWNGGSLYTRLDEGMELEVALNASTNPVHANYTLNIDNVQFLCEDDHILDWYLPMDDSNFTFTDCTFLVSNDATTIMRGNGWRGCNVEFNRCVLDNSAKPIYPVRLRGDLIAKPNNLVMKNCLIKGGDLLGSEYMVETRATNAKFYFCTFWSPNEARDTRACISASSSGGLSLDVVNCIFADCFKTPIAVAGAAMNYAIDANLFAHPAAGGELGTNSIVGSNPLFVSVPGDFHLQTGSLALEAGQNAAMALVGNVDLEGAARPNPAGSRPDLGCYERAGTVSSVADWALFD